MNKIGVIAALPVEARCLYPETIPQNRSVDLGHGVSLRVAGVGQENARQAANAFIGDQVSLLVSWGVAAALVDDAATGSLVLADRVIGDSGRVFEVRPEILGTLKLFADKASLETVTGSLAECHEILTGQEDKQRLHGKTGAVAADMESAAIASAATQAGLPFLCVRAISDDVNTDIPPSVSVNMRPSGNINLAGLLKSLVMKPSDLRELVRLARAFKRARGTLIQCAGYFKARPGK
ncbi:MAG: hypothetical protein R3318_05345 [Gammaproteobacteria bacterium]|nr:hypothetical protein [Gammaproteobacteria bacterium]